MPTDATLLAFPYPYRTALAFVTDIDATTFASFVAVHERFYGLAPGFEEVGLELANSFWIAGSSTDGAELDGFVPDKTSDIYIHDRSGQRDPKIGEALAPFLSGPLFEAIHTYGPFAAGDFSRDDARICLDLMDRHGIAPRLWSYHGSAIERQNIGFDRADWQGDRPGSDAYHLDLLTAQGDLRFVRIPPSLPSERPGAVFGISEAADGQRLHTLQCHGMRNRAPQAEMRDWLSRLRSLDATNLTDDQVFKSSDRLPDNALMWSPELLPFQIADPVLNASVAKGRALYLNQHLTRAHAQGCYALPEMAKALKGLTARARRGDTLVTGPARLASFETARDHMRWRTERPRPGALVIHIDATLAIGDFTRPLHEDELEGIAFITEEADVTVLHGDRLAHQFVTQPHLNGRFLTHWPWSSRLEDQREALRAFAKTFVPA